MRSKSNKLLIVITLRFILPPLLTELKGLPEWFIQSISNWLDRCDSAADVVRITGWAVGIYAAVLWGSGARWIGSESNGEPWSAPVLLAEVTAGITGIVLAIITFSVGLHAERKDSSAFAVSMLVIKHRTWPLVGVLFGITTAHLLMVLLIEPQWTAGFAWFDAIVLLIVFFCVIGYFFSSIRDASVSVSGESEIQVSLKWMVERAVASRVAPLKGRLARWTMHVARFAIPGMYVSPTAVTLFRRTVRRAERNLIEAAEHGDVSAFDLMLDEAVTVIRKIADAGQLMELEDSDGAWGLRSYVALGPEELGISTAVRIAVERKDERLLRSIVSFLGSCSYIAVTRKGDGLLRESLSLTQFCYYQSLRGELASESTSHAFDALARDLFLGFSSNYEPSEEDADLPSNAAFMEERSRIDHVLQTTLSLIRSAIEFDRERDARAFIHHVNAVRGRRHRMGGANDDSQIEFESWDTLLGYFRYAIAGWAIRSLGEQNQLQLPQEAMTAATVLTSVLDQPPSRASTALLWEFYQTKGGPQGKVMERLDLGFWDLESRSGESFAGEVKGGFVDQHWPMRGMLAFMLKGHGPWVHEWDQELVHPPSDRFIWDNIDQISKDLFNISSVTELDLVDSQRTESVHDCIDLIKKRQASASLAWHTKVHETDVGSSSFWPTFKEKVAEKYVVASHIRAALFRRGVNAPASPLTANKNVAKNRVPRELFVDGNIWHDSFSLWLGEGLAHVESVNTLGAMSDVMPETDPLKRLIDIQNSVRMAASRLRVAGFSPSLIIIPDLNRFLIHLLGTATWRHEAYETIKKHRYYLWDDMLILQWPFSNPSSLVVADSSKLFSGTESPESTIEVRYEEQWDGKTKIDSHKMAEDAKQGIDPEREDVLIEASIAPSIGIADIKAGLAIPILESDGAYRVPRGSGMYHRANCYMIRDSESYEGSLSIKKKGKDENLKPCKICKPDRWDYERELE